VRRGGREVEIVAADMVVGDLVLLSEGDRLSADARLVRGSVEVDMAPLTGESAVVARNARAPHSRTGLLNAEDLVFAGTLVTEGEAQALVYATGMATQLGRIAALSQRVEPEISPLQRQVNRAAQLIAMIAVGCGLVFFVIGTLFAGLSLQDSSTFAIGLQVANVPAVITCTEEMAEQHPELVVTFMKGMIKVGRWSNEHKHAAAAILDKQTFYLDADDTYRNIKNIDMVPTLSPQNLAAVEIGKDFMLSHGYIKNDFDVDEWAHPEFLEQAATEVLKEEWERRSWSKLPEGGGLEVEGMRLG
jgi:phosphohistidine swiveling domain-containing protein